MTRIMQPPIVDASHLRPRPLRTLFVLLVSFFLSTIALPDAALAAQTIEFPNGGHARLADDGSITGTCQLTGGRISLETGYHATAVMPDGSRIQAGCYERYSGAANHNLYPGPCDGSYSFKATKRGNGYFVLIYSQNAASPAPGALVSQPPAGYTYQHTYGENWTPEITSTVTFKKVSADPDFTETVSAYSLANASYDIFDAKTDAKVGSITTDAKGNASCKLTRGKSYYAVETAAPEGYALNPKRVSFTAGNKPVELADEPMRVEVSIRKTDSATAGAAQPGTTLEGATFKLVDSRGVAQHATTDANGHAKFSSVPLGMFSIVETRAPQGYKLDQTVHTYNVGSDAEHEDGVISLSLETDFPDDVTAFDIELAKYKENPNEAEGGVRWPAQGVQFLVISKSTGETVATLTTDEYGFARTPDDAWYGEGTRPEGVRGSIPFDGKGYLVREVASTVPDGYERMSDFTIGVDEQVDGAQLKYIIENKTPAARLQIVKTDTRSGQVVPLAGFTFRLLSEDGKPVTQSAWYPNHVRLDKFTTDASGCTTLPEQLIPGTYYLEEIAARPPYVLADEPLKVELGHEGGSVAVVQFEDKQATGRASIQKTDADTGKGLEGAVFNVVSRETITSPDGTVQAVEGEVLGNVTTDESGLGSIDGLPLGNGNAAYAFVETKAPDGYVLDPTPLEFSLDYRDDATPVVEACVNATDSPTEVVVLKSELGSDAPLAGVHFLLKRLPDDGDDASEAAEIGQVTDKNGVARWTHVLPGTYTLTETQAPNGYVLDGRAWTVTIDEQGKVWHEGTQTNELDIENDFIKVDITKRDITNEEELPGAHLAVFDDTGTLVERWVSERKPHRIERLAPGTYTLKEERTPATHDGAEDVSFTVEETGEVQVITMYDEPIEIDGVVDKRQEIVRPIAPGTHENGDGKNRAEARESDSGEYSYYLDWKNASNTWVDEFTITDTLTCCEEGLAELTGITTPVSQGDYDGKFNVWYMTNLPDNANTDDEATSATTSDGHDNPWLVGMDTLHPLDAGGRVMSFDGWGLWRAGIPSDEATELSLDELDLREGERVVAVRFEYGCVNEGFATRADERNREWLKDEHDDMDDTDEAKSPSEASETALSPAVLRMRVTDAYTAGAVLKNYVQLDAFRNGGGDELEAHDFDYVEQAAGNIEKPVSPLRKMPKMGDISTALLATMAFTGMTAIAAGVVHENQRRKNINGNGWESRRCDETRIRTRQSLPLD